jgi:hypothetical protein
MWEDDVFIRGLVFDPINQVQCSVWTELGACDWLNNDPEFSEL